MKSNKKELKEADQKLVLAYQKIEESEERFKLAMKAANDGLFDWNLESNAIYYSPMWKKMLGYEDHELPNDFTVWESLTEAEDVQKSWAMQQKLISKKIDRFVMEFKMKHKEGHWVDILSRAEAIFDESGKAVRIVGTHTDVTERNRSQAKLKDSQNYLSAIFNNTQDAQILSEYVSHNNFKVVAVNHAYVRKVNQFGIALSEQEIINKTLKELIVDLLQIDEEVYNYTLNYYQEVTDTNKPIKYQESFDINDKPYHSESIYVPIHNLEDGRKLVLFTSRDVTKEKESIEKLRSSEERFSLAVQGSNDAIWDWNDLESDEYYWSDRLYEILGYQPGEVEARISNWKKWMHPDDRQRVFRVLKEHFEKNKAYEVEFRMKKKNGRYAWLFARGESVRDENGIPIRMAGSVSDISKRKKAEAELIASKLKAEESDRLKSSFLANMSHEIRTPMNGILGFAELLKGKELAKVKKQKYLDIIEKSGNRMLEIINDIIDISKIESGVMEVELTDLNINEQLEYIYTFFKPEVKEKGIRLNFHNGLPSHQAVVTSDKEKLLAILTNLVKNAIKYTLEGTIDFGYKKRGGHLEFYVRDTGYGIPKDRLDAIFERFVQSDITNVMARQGVGLGLAITKSYVKMLQGDIWVESEENVGSTFFFSLPYQVQNKSNLSVDRSVTSNEEMEILPLNLNLRVLIAEDDEVSKSLLSDMVEGFGAEIIHANTGLEAIELCREMPDIDLILMDIRMPELNGYEACRRIRNFNKDIVIIAQTAFALTGDREKAIEAGCNDHIVKPIKKIALNSLLRKYFNKRQVID